MPSAQGTRVYFGKQSAKGTPATALHTAGSLLTITDTSDKTVVDGVPILGGTLQVQRGIGVKFGKTFTVTGRVTVDRMIGMITEFLFTRVTTGPTAVALYTHTYSPITKNYNVPWFTVALIFEEQTTLGTGIMTQIIRDAKCNALNFTLDSEGVLEYTASFNALNEGDSAGTETYDEDTTYYIVVPNGPTTNAYVYPAWFPGTLCVTSLNINIAAPATVGPACLGSGEASGIDHTGMSVTVTGSAYADANSVDIYKQIHYGTATAGSISASSALTPILKEGAASFKITTAETLVGTTPDTPAHILFNLPSLQWRQATHNRSNTPQLFDFEAMSFGTDFGIVLANLKTGLQMAA